ncbi:MAG TPA: hypothetical protein DCM64_01390 [Gammaproteobacteria bacterium]|nr:YihY/virulence factor BrkB family protein [Gammaproteobacteria bacterium]HAJ75086.1 hypothetical protein [Gammaproteobacteria bacterium]
MALQTSNLQALMATLRSRSSAFIWQPQLEAQPFWKRLLIRSLQILRAVLRDMVSGQLSLRAMSLVFITVIGFFPLLALTFAVLKSLGVHNAMEDTLLTLLQPLGEQANELTAQVLDYVDSLQVEVIGIISIGVLLYLLLDMMRKIESSFNYIWAVKQGRSWSSRISEYLFAVIVSPLLLSLSISITSYVNTNFFERVLQNLIYGGLILEFTAFIVSILLMSLAFAFAYGFLPNTRVKFGSAFIGGLVTTIIWKLMGSVFQGFFVASARESIYLAFATPIAVMFFIYIGWLVALIGSSIAFYHQHPAKARTGRGRLQLSISQQEQLNLAVATAIIQRFTAGGEPMNEDELAATIGSSPVAIESALQTLENIGLIVHTGEEPSRFLPSKSVTECTLVDIWKAVRHYNKDQLYDAAESDTMLEVREFQASLDAAVEQQLGQHRIVSSSPSDSPGTPPADITQFNLKTGN